MKSRYAYILLCISICLVFMPSIYTGNARSRAYSFFMPRAVSDQLLYTHGSKVTPRHQKNKNTLGLTLSHRGFFATSLKSKKLAEYFFGDGKQSLRVAGDSTGDIHPSWFSVAPKFGQAPYLSTLTCAPEREVYGVMLQATQQLPLFEQEMWVSVSLPVAHITHRLNLQEQGVTSGTLESGSMPTMLAALDNSNWRAGRLSTQALSQYSAGDATITLGYTYRKEKEADDYQSWYTQLLLPLAPPQTGRYLFEPTTGHAGHYGISGGIESLFSLYRRNGIGIALSSGINYRYMFSHTEQRLPDLAGQPFSRYLVLMDTTIGRLEDGVVKPKNFAGPMYAYKAANGVNFLHRDCLVQPGMTGQHMNSLIFSYNRHSCTIGYQYWWRNKEHIQFTDSWSAVHADKKVYAVPSQKPITSTVPQEWEPSARIYQEWLNLSIDNTGELIDVGDITADTKRALPNVWHEGEFDMAAAAAPRAAATTIFASYQYGYVLGTTAIGIDIGGLYEIADKATALSTVGGWAHIEMKF